MTSPQIILGSASPWRAKVLKDAGIPFIVRTADIDEKVIRHADPTTMVHLIARAKAEAITPTLRAPAFLITCDQVVVFNGEIREKPKNAEQAIQWMMDYRGRTLSCITAVRVERTDNGGVVVGTSKPRIWVGDKMTYEEMLAAVDRGRVLSACGALVREDPVFAQHIVHISGEHGDALEQETAIQGLPIRMTTQLLRELGWQGPGR